MKIKDFQSQENYKFSVSENKYVLLTFKFKYEFK